MTARWFRLTEIHQRIDALQRREQARRHPDALRLTRLADKRLRVKRLIHAILPGALRA